MDSQSGGSIGAKLVPIGQTLVKLNVSLKMILLLGHQDDAQSAWRRIYRTNHTHLKLLARQNQRRANDIQ